MSSRCGFKKVEEKEIELFLNPSRIILSGLSGSGKTTFAQNLVEKYQNSFHRIISIGSDLGKNIKNLERIDDFDVFNDIETDNEKILIFLDDCIFNKKLLNKAADIFTRGRHLGVSIILISQTIFLNDCNFRICMMNATHIGLFKNRSIKSVALFARSFLLDKQINNFLYLYRRLVLKKPYGYCFLDFDKDFEENPLAIRSNIVEVGFERCYLI